MIPKIRKSQCNNDVHSLMETDVLCLFKFLNYTWVCVNGCILTPYFSSPCTRTPRLNVTQYQFHEFLQVCHCSLCSTLVLRITGVICSVTKCRKSYCACVHTSYYIHVLQSYTLGKCRPNQQPYSAWFLRPVWCCPLQVNTRKILIVWTEVQKTSNQSSSTSKSIKFGRRPFG